MSGRGVNPVVKDLTSAAERLNAAKRLLLDAYGLTSQLPSNRPIAALITATARAEMILHRDLTAARDLGGA